MNLTPIFTEPITTNNNLYSHSPNEISFTVNFLDLFTNYYNFLKSFLTTHKLE